LKYYDDPSRVGRRLRAAREAAGLTQRDLATTGCTAAYVSRIEKGERIPSLQLMRHFSAKLGISEEFLAHGVKKSTRPQLSSVSEARVALRLGELQTAEGLAQSALSIAQSDAERALASVALAEIRLASGDYRNSIELLERARRIDPAIEERDEQAGETLGRAYARAFEYESAVAVFLRNRARAQGAGDILNEVRFGSLLAHAYTDAGNFSAAEEAIAGAIQASEAVDDPLARARTLWAQSRVHALQKDSDTAALYAERALEVLQVSDHDYYAALAHQLLAHIELDRGNGDRAIELLRKADPLIQASGRPFEQASFKVELSRALLATGRREEAASSAMEASGALRDASPVDAGRCYLLVGDVFAEMGDESRAAELYELAAEQLKATPNRYLVEAYSKLAAVFESRGDQAGALAALKEAMAVQKTAERMLVGTA
jgi:tetratricopeptide (TPR) repeat protein